MRGTCEQMCADFEMEFREYTGEVNPLEAVRVVVVAPNNSVDMDRGRMINDVSTAVKP